MVRLELICGVRLRVGEVAGEPARGRKGVLPRPGESTDEGRGIVVSGGRNDVPGRANGTAPRNDSERMLDRPLRRGSAASDGRLGIARLELKLESGSRKKGEV